MSCKWFGIKDENTTFSVLVLSTLGIFCLFSTNSLADIFYWYTGICVNTLPLCFVFFTIACYFQYDISEKKIYLVVGNVCAFIGAGGALCISGLFCSILLFCIIYNLVVLKKIKRNITMGVVALIGSTINVIAPGNFVRHSVIDSEIRVGLSVVTTIFRIHDEIARGFQHGFLLLLIVATFLYGYNNLKESQFEYKYPLLVTLYCYLGIFITDFPVVLGYSHANLDGRVAFIESVAIVIFCMAAALYWGGWSARKELFNFTKELYFIIVLVCLVPMLKYLDLDQMLELTQNKILYHIVNGDYKTFSERELNIIYDIENSQEQDVIIFKPKKDDNEWTDLKNNRLTSDPTYYVNYAVAEYYGKNTVIVYELE